LRLFQAQVGKGAHPYPSVRIWAPWNLKMGERSCLASGVDCYNVAMIELGSDSIISQRSFLCSASHDYQSPGFELISGPIVIGRKAWVGAEAFVGPGVSIGDGTVIGARSVVIQNVPSWVVAVGHPTRIIKSRVRS
jgi:putative colanic acid biosynthesis acetyltransferase WcaF